MFCILCKKTEASCFAGLGSFLATFYSGEMVAMGYILYKFQPHNVPDMGLKMSGNLQIEILIKKVLVHLL